MAEGKCGPHVEWNISSGTLIISGHGQMTSSPLTACYEKEALGIQRIIVKEGVTSLPENAFTEYSNVVSVKLPESLKVIGKEAFARCSSLEKVEFPVALKEIHARAFTFCTALKNIDVPDSVQKIEASAFSECCNLEQVRLPERLKEIPNSAFYGCSSLQKIELPPGVERIESCAFANCKRLQDVKLPYGLTEIERIAFGGCTSLHEIYMPDTVRTIGWAAFMSSGLDKVRFSNNLTRIEAKAFKKTPWLEHAREKNPFVMVNDILLDGKACKGEIKIPAGIKVIAPEAFAKSDVTKVEFHKSVNEIGKCAFYRCPNLESVKIPATVQNIGESAFFLCPKLQDVKVPEKCDVSTTAFEHGCNIERYSPKDTIER